MNDDKIIARLFDRLKDTTFYTTLKSGHVKIHGGATYGDWAEVGRIIDPSHPRPIEVAEDFMYNHKKDAKELRTQIAQWRKDNPEDKPYDEKEYNKGIRMVAEQLLAMAKEDDLDAEELAEYVTDAVTDLQVKINELRD